jgi:hypothetical protein
MNERGTPEGPRGGVTQSQRWLETGASAPRISRTDSGTQATIYFSAGDFLLNSANAGAVAELRRELARNPGSRVTINGFASAEGSEVFNEMLSASSWDEKAGLLECTSSAPDHRERKCIQFKRPAFSSQLLGVGRRLS